MGIFSEEETVEVTRGLRGEPGELMLAKRGQSNQSTCSMVNVKVKVMFEPSLI